MNSRAPGAEPAVRGGGEEGFGDHVRPAGSLDMNGRLDGRTPPRGVERVRARRIAAVMGFQAMSRIMRAAPAGRSRAAWLVLAALLTWAAAAGAAEIVVVAHPDLPVDALSAQQLRNIYLGELTHVAHVKVQPVGYAGNSAMSDAFLRTVVGMNPRRFDTYWIKEVFHSGRVPPLMVEGPDEMLRTVAGEAGAIGFVPAESLEGVTSVKRVYTVSIP